MRYLLGTRYIWPTHLFTRTGSTWQVLVMIFWGIVVPITMFWSSFSEGKRCPSWAHICTTSNLRMKHWHQPYWTGLVQVLTTWTAVGVAERWNPVNSAIWGQKRPDNESWHPPTTVALQQHSDNWRRDLPKNWKDNWDFKIKKEKKKNWQMETLGFWLRLPLLWQTLYEKFLVQFPQISSK